METEYATLVADPESLDRDDLPPSRMVYVQICEAIRRDQPTVSGLFDSEQMFLASGGAVTFESHPTQYTAPGGLVEFATPEVRSPDELLACQRSIDALASDATSDSETSFDIRVLKNSSDALGHVYGCQENYEAVVATGFMAGGLPRLHSFVLWMMQILSSLIASLPLVAIHAGGRWRSSRWVKPRPRRIPDEPHEMFDAVPDVAVSRLMIGIAFASMHLPTVMVLRFVARHVAFRSATKVS